MKSLILRFLKQPSTWQGLIMLSTAIGVQLSPEVQEHFITTGLSLVGFISIVTDEDKGASS